MWSCLTPFTSFYIFCLLQCRSLSKQAHFESMYVFLENNTVVTDKRLLLKRLVVCSKLMDGGDGSPLKSSQPVHTKHGCKPFNHPSDTLKYALQNMFTINHQ